MNSVTSTISSEAAATIELARSLIRLDTANPPGNESLAADLVEARLRIPGISIERIQLAEGRESLIARLNAEREGEAICFCGHLDTVPFGNRAWQRGAQSADIEGGRLWGRGSTDMKAGVAAMVTAFERLADSGFAGKVTLALCASEETGCQGAAQIADALHDVGLMIVGEPTTNAIAIAHKGVLWLRLTAVGTAAHGSMPHLGVNAIERMTDAIEAIRRVEFNVSAHALLGTPTLNIGTINGGAATNIVADRCELTLDIRLVPGLSADQAHDTVRSAIGPEFDIETLLSLDAVSTEPGDPWIAKAGQRLLELGQSEIEPTSVSYFTDASILAKRLRSPRVLIVGPGDKSLAHQVDESCSVNEIWRSSQFYEQIARDWASTPSNLQKGE